MTVLVPRVLAFNLGIELGRLLAIAGMIGVGLVIRRVLPRLRDTRLAHGTLAAVTLAVAGGETQAMPFGPARSTERVFDPAGEVAGRVLTGHRPWPGASWRPAGR
ncbi:hypothetical protein Ga0074812_15411 [Parafrankia irregularis]|uniref:Uncharacterized protein n=1 Tax=Parafrankia irregularis TaxID=795642 RepID=A0A0S4R1G8_9ACTN|nr:MULTISPECIES: hypothetical protein [Parafrankia]CUU61052.1 hypothetical protein Ga0074812_15411 [Parafrankia irregularis]